MTPIRKIASAVCLSFMTIAGSVSAAPTLPVRSDDIVMGSPNAPVTVVEYASTTCSHCAAFDLDVFPDLKAKYIDTGKVKWIIRELLTPPDDASAAGSELARCAGPKAYYKVLDALWLNQPLLQEDNALPWLAKGAQAAGFDQKALEDCLGDSRHLWQVRARSDEGGHAGVNGTPTFFINGEFFYSGEPHVKALIDALDRAAPKKPRRAKSH